MQSISAILSLCNIISSINFSILTDYKLFTLDYKSCFVQRILSTKISSMVKERQRFFLYKSLLKLCPF